MCETGRQRQKERKEREGDRLAGVCEGQTWTKGERDRERRERERERKRERDGMYERLTVRRRKIKNERESENERSP